MFNICTEAVPGRRWFAASQYEYVKIRPLRTSTQTRSLPRKLQARRGLQQGQQSLCLENNFKFISRFLKEINFTEIPAKPSALREFTRRTNMKPGRNQFMPKFDRHRHPFLMSSAQQNLLFSIWCFMLFSLSGTRFYLPRWWQRSVVWFLSSSKSDKMW